MTLIKLIVIAAIGITLLSPTVEAHKKHNEQPTVTAEQLIHAFQKPANHSIKVEGKDWFINTHESCGRFLGKKVDPKSIEILRTDFIQDKSLLVVTFLADKIEAHTLYFEVKRGPHYEVGPDKKAEPGLK